MTRATNRLPVSCCLVAKFAGGAGERIFPGRSMHPVEINALAAMAQHRRCLTVFSSLLKVELCRSIPPETGINTFTCYPATVAIPVEDHPQTVTRRIRSITRSPSNLVISSILCWSASRLGVWKKSGDRRSGCDHFFVFRFGLHADLIDHQQTTLLRSLSSCSSLVPLFLKVLSSPT